MIIKTARDLNLLEEAYIKENHPEVTDEDLQTSRKIVGLAGTTLGGGGGLLAGDAIARRMQKAKGITGGSANKAARVGAAVGGLLGAGAGGAGMYYGTKGALERDQERQNTLRASEIERFQNASPEDTANYLNSLQERELAERQLEIDAQRNRILAEQAVATGEIGKTASELFLKVANDESAEKITLRDRRDANREALALAGAVGGAGGSLVNSVRRAKKLKKAGGKPSVADSLGKAVGKGMAGGAAGALAGTIEPFAGVRAATEQNLGGVIRGKNNQNAPQGEYDKDAMKNRVLGGAVTEGAKFGLGAAPLAAGLSLFRKGDQAASLMLGATGLGALKGGLQAGAGQKMAERRRDRRLEHESQQ